MTSLAKKCALGAASFVLLLCVAVGGALAWLTQNRDWVCGHVVVGIEEALGQSCSLGDVAVFFDPWPTIVLTDFSTEGDLYALSFSKAHLTPSLLGLIQNSFSGTVSLKDPFFKLFALPKKTASSGGFSANALPRGLLLEIENGSCLLPAEGHHLHLEGLECSLQTELDQDIEGDIFIHNGSFVLGTETFRLADVLCMGTVELDSFWLNDTRLNLSFHLTNDSWLKDFTLQASVDQQKSVWQARTKINGAIEKDGTAIPYGLVGDIALESAKKLLLRLAELGLGERDRGRFTGEMDLEKKALSGTLSLAHVSLTEWLGFGRVLPPGLQNALDNVTEAELLFRIDSEGLSVPKVVASCAGSRFMGRGGVERWSKPVVFLDMEAEAVDLLRAIPEAGAVLPKGPVFTHGAFTPEHSNPQGTGPDVGYDINLGAKQVAYGPLLLQKAKVRIHPAPKNADGSEDIVLDGRAGFYEGRFEGNCVIGGDVQPTFAIKGTFVDVQGAGVGRALPVIPIRKGKWNASLAVTSQSKELEPFLKRLRGTVRVEGRQGELGVGQSRARLPFSLCQARLESLKGGFFTGSKLGLEGLWKGKLEEAGLSLTVEGPGTLWFGKGAQKSSGVECQNVPVSAQLKLDAIPQGLVVQAKTRLSAQISPFLLRFGDLHVASLGAEMTGQGELSNPRDGLLVQGKANCAVPDLKEFCSKILGTTTQLPVSLRSLAGNFAFKWTPTTLLFSELQLRSGPLSLSGEIERNLKNGLLGLRVALGHCDVDSLLSEIAASKTSTIETKWLAPIRAKGSIAFTELVFKKTHFFRLKVPFVLQNGHLDLSAITGILYRGNLRGDIHLDLASPLQLKSSFVVTDIDLKTFGHEKVKDAALAGNCNLSAALQAKFSRVADWPQCLNSTWSLRTRKGSYQSLRADGRPKGSAVTFSTFQASGKIRQGILESKDIFLAGDDLRLKGKAEVNLAKETIDCQLEVDKSGVPLFPIYMEGTFDKIKTRIGAGKLILNAVGGIFKGIFGIFQ